MISLHNVRKFLDSGMEVDSMKVWTAEGDILEYKNVRCTSSNYKRNTFNLLFLESGEVRTVRAYNIFEFNNKEVMI